MKSNKNVVLITGASSGIGEACVKKFLDEGWYVVATSRAKPNYEFSNDRLSVYALDVTSQDQISSVVSEAISKHGRIDVLVNNAGYGLAGPLEQLSHADITKQFDVNVYGLIAVTQTVLPHMREASKGTIIMMSSMFGHISMPFMSIYGATKHAVEGLSEALQHEVDNYGIQVKLIEPGAIKTKFFDNMKVAKLPTNSPYAERLHGFISNISKTGSSGADPDIAAQSVYRAAHSNRFRFVPDRTAKNLLFLHKIMPFGLFRKSVRRFVG